MAAKTIVLIMSHLDRQFWGVNHLHKWYLKMNYKYQIYFGIIFYFLEPRISWSIPWNLFKHDFQNALFATS